MAVAQIGTLNTFAAGGKILDTEHNSNYADIKTAFNNLVTGANTLNIDTISEVTSANGVVVDGVTLKDGGITASGTVLMSAAEGLRINSATAFISGYDVTGTTRTGLLQFNSASATILAININQGFEIQTNNTSQLTISAAGAFRLINTDQTGIAVSAAGIHAALVNLGLITA